MKMVTLGPGAFEGRNVDERGHGVRLVRERVVLAVGGG
jgi:hypothetical protein